MPDDVQDYKRQRFEAMIKYAEEGKSDLTLADRLIIRNCVNAFVDNYTYA